MECPICKNEMINGKIKIYEMGDFILHHATTMKFIPNDKMKKSVKADPWKEKQGYCCEKCNNIVVIAPIQEKWF